jgi:hypothetical protein
MANGIRLELRFARSRPIASWMTAPAGILQRWQHRRIPWQRLAPGSEDPARSGGHWSRAAIGRRQLQLAGGGARTVAVVRGFRGDPGTAVSSLSSISAHSQRLLRSSCRGGGGNTIGFDFMWVVGRVQSAVAGGGCFGVRAGSVG